MAELPGLSRKFLVRRLNGGRRAAVVGSAHPPGRFVLPAIRVLPDAVIDQIAAGEVIERPASVVKELIENALDAGATRIEVEIEDGGGRRISVADDGTGMDAADAVLAFRRHATSKIAGLEDLERAGTLGFRGEALPSIASVASVRLRTRRAQDPSGVEVLAGGGEVSAATPAARAPGTTVEVVDLFEAVPARRKFLKSAVTEGGHVVAIVERLALARPDVRFALAKEGKPALVLPPTRDARERAVAVLPPLAAARLVSVEGRIASASVRGFVTSTDVMRGSSADLHLYVNGRPVRDRYLLHLVGAAYRDALPPGRHPAGVLWLSVDPGDVDANVHPAKWEVRFRDPGAIRALLGSALRSALGASVDVRIAAPGPLAPLARPGDFVRELPLHAFHAAPESLLSSPGLSARREARPDLPFQRLRYLGQALGVYLVLEGPAGLVLLDQHAAHERVLFERLREAHREGKLERQRLLVPVRAELPRADAERLLAHAPALARAGFEIESEESGLHGGRQLLLRALPAPVAGLAADWGALLEETAVALREAAPPDAIDGLEGALHAAFASAACHAACRKGQRLDPREVAALLVALDKTVWYPNCPHGRPIWLHLDSAELSRRFQRS